MSTFEATRNMRVQTHFEVFEIDLPVITGTCTVGGDQGFGTPLTCDQAWSNEYKTYYFTNTNAPILPSVNGEPIHRCITSIRESATELKPGDGLSSRGSLGVSFNDFTKQDPNSTATGVTDSVKNQGTYFGKLNARQIFENKSVRLKLYRVEPDGSVDLVNGAQSRSYVANAFKLNSKTGTWTLECKDVLSVVNVNEKSWPISTGGFVRLDVDDTSTAIPVDGNTDYSLTAVVRIGDEHLNVLSVSGNLTASAFLNVSARGSSIIAPISGLRLTATFASSHSAGDEVFISDVSDNETIDDFITRVLVESDYDPALIPSAAWAAEVAEWHSADKLNTLHSESEDVNAVIQRVLTGYLMDSWFDVTDGLTQLSAISVWKQSTATLTEGKEINTDTIKKTPKESLRASRALVLYDKVNLSDSDDIPSYKKGARFSDNTIISEALFSKHKDKQFDNNFLLGSDAAELLTQRYVSRFKFTPFVRTFKTEERFLTFKTGDVVDLSSSVDQGPDGLNSSNIRAQVLKVNPRYEKYGRVYDVTTMSYEAAFSTGTEIVLDGTLSESNLYILAGAPSQVVEITFLLTKHSEGLTGFRAGSGWAAGSKIILILDNGFDGQASGGAGGNGQGLFFDQELNRWLGIPGSSNGGSGGTVYDAMNVTTDIYFSGATPSAAYPVADGYIRAPGAGGFGSNSNQAGTPDITAYGGNSGGGGAGRAAGSAGNFGEVTPSSGKTVINGGQALDGDIIGNGGTTNDIAQSPVAENGGDWGQSTTFNSAGKGVVDSGATVTFFGDTPTRYINGTGDH